MVIEHEREKAESGTLETSEEKSVEINEIYNEELYENKQWYSNGQLKLDLKGESGKVISLRRWDKKGKEIDCNEKGKNINSVLDKYLNRPS